jgi:hypothetical protein
LMAPKLAEQERGKPALNVTRPTAVESDPALTQTLDAKARSAS